MPEKRDVNLDSSFVSDLNALLMKDAKPEPDLEMEHRGNCYACAWSPAGNKIATSSSELIKIWDLNSGKQVNELVGHTSNVGSLDWLDHNTLVSASDDNRLRFWNVNEPKEKQLAAFCGHFDAVVCCRVSPNKQWVASCDTSGTILIWDLSGNVIRSIPNREGPVWSIGWSQNGTRLLAIVEQSWRKQVGLCKIFDSLSGKLLQISEDRLSRSMWSCDWAPFDSRYAIAYHDKLVEIYDADQRDEANPDSSKKLKKLGLSDERPLRICKWSPNGLLIATGSSTGLVEIYEPDSGVCLNSFSAHQSNVWSISWSPCSRSLCTSSVDRYARTWSILR